MSLIQNVQTLWLIAREHALQYQLFLNNERTLSAIRNPINLETAYHLDLQTSLSNAAIIAELATIKAQRESLGKNLDTYA